ncbi:MAG: hypothetical protein ABIK81_01985 [candidate division WOR-3 bacterium]
MNETDIEKLARLAYLYLPSDEREKLKPSLKKIIEYFKTIRHLREKTLPDRLPEITCPRRQEEEKIHQEIKIASQYLKSLPNYRKDYFQVPKIRE